MAKRGRKASRVRGVFMISVAAELAGMHPQTLRVYEQRGLIKPNRSAKKTRLYSQADVERLRYIHELTVEMGMNLAGVERVFELEQVVIEMRGQLELASEEIERMKKRYAREIEAVHRSYRREIVPYERHVDIVLAEEAAPPKGFRIQIKRGKK